MTMPFDRMHPDHTPPDLAAIEAGLLEVARDARARPDAGFEDRLTAASVNASTGRPALRIAHQQGGRSLRSLPSVRWGLAAAAALAIVSSIVAFRWQPTRATTDPTGVVSVASSVTELDEIADVWDLLDDADIASRVSSLQGRTATVADSISGEWNPSSWLGEDSM